MVLNLAILFTLTIFTLYIWGLGYWMYTCLKLLSHLLNWVLNYYTMILSIFHCFKLKVYLPDINRITPNLVFDSFSTKYLILSLCFQSLHILRSEMSFLYTRYTWVLFFSLHSVTLCLLIEEFNTLTFSELSIGKVLLHTFCNSFSNSFHFFSSSYSLSLWLYYLF